MKKLSEAWIPTKWGKFKMISFGEDKDQYSPHLALIHEKFDPEQVTMVRIHSECITGDVFSSMRCDCGDQLHLALELVARAGGVLVYLRQEGRGIGISHKLDAYELQDQGMNTIEANVHLGFEPDERDYNDAFTILKELGIQRISLLTNNPDKLQALQKKGVEIVERLPLISETNRENRDYLETKRREMGHLFNP